MRVTSTLKGSALICAEFPDDIPLIERVVVQSHATLARSEQGASLAIVTLSTTKSDSTELLGHEIAGQLESSGWTSRSVAGRPVIFSSEYSDKALFREPDGSVLWVEYVSFEDGSGDFASTIGGEGYGFVQYIYCLDETCRSFYADLYETP